MAPTITTPATLARLATAALAAVLIASAVPTADAKSSRRQDSKTVAHTKSSHARTWTNKQGPVNNTNSRAAASPSSKARAASPSSKQQARPASHAPRHNSSHKSNSYNKGYPSKGSYNGYSKNSYGSKKSYHYNNNYKSNHHNHSHHNKHHHHNSHGHYHHKNKSGVSIKLNLGGGGYYYSSSGKSGYDHGYNKPYYYKSYSSGNYCYPSYTYKKYAYPAYSYGYNNTPTYTNNNTYQNVYVYPDQPEQKYSQADVYTYDPVNQAYIPPAQAHVPATGNPYISQGANSQQMQGYDQNAPPQYTYVPSSQRADAPTSAPAAPPQPQQAPAQHAPVTLVNATHAPAWRSIAEDDPTAAYAQFSQAASRDNNDALAKTGFALAAAMRGDRGTATWAIRRAITLDATVLDRVPTDAELRQRILPLIDEYESIEGDTDALLMVGALRAIAGDDRTALIFLDAAIGRGDHSAELRNLRNHLQSRLDAQRTQTPTQRPTTTNPRTAGIVR